VRSLLVVTPYLPPAGGGLERYAVTIASNLASRHGWRVTFVSSGSPSRLVRTERREGNTVYLLPTAFTWSNTPFHPAWPRQIARIIAAEQPDVVCAHTPVPGIAECAAFATRDRPFVLTYHMGTLAKGSFPADQVAYVYENFVLRWLARRAVWIISSSDYVYSFHRAQFGAKGTAIAPGVDTTRFWGRPGPRPARIMFVAALGPGTAHKGLPDLLMAMVTVAREHPAAELVIVGDGETRPELERMADALGVSGQVRFVGHLEGEALAEMYRSARVLAMPSHNDNIPMVVLEAMASRVAVVATRVGLVPELLDEGNRGILIEAGDIAGMAAGLGRLITDDALAQRFGAAGRELVEASYNWSVQADKTEEVLARVLGGAAR
jgi:glycosyltransferase involved in cell wall biosynthesis